VTGLFPFYQSEFSSHLIKRIYHLQLMLHLIHFLLHAIRAETFLDSCFFLVLEVTLLSVDSNRQFFRKSLTLYSLYEARFLCKLSPQYFPV
jgi:hypothetical protein